MEYRHSLKTDLDMADWYDFKYLEMGDGWNTPEEECNKHLDNLGVTLDKSKLLMDVGCGAGHFLEQATKRCQCVGIELSRVGIRYALARAPLATFICRSVCDLYSFSTLSSYADYIVSMGSIEHIIDLASALETIRYMLKPTGKWYFYVPNEKWIHEDQPNERTMSDEAWSGLFTSHGLTIHRVIPYGDNTAFIGGRK